MHICNLLTTTSQTQPLPIPLTLPLKYTTLSLSCLIFKNGLITHLISSLHLCLFLALFILGQITATVAQLFINKGNCSKFYDSPLRSELSFVELSIVSYL